MIDLLLNRIDDFRYRFRLERWCVLGIHKPGLWSDYSFIEPPDPYWHCERCGVEAYPLRFRVEDWLWESRVGRRLADWLAQREYDRLYPPEK